MNKAVRGVGRDPKEGVVYTTMLQYLMRSLVVCGPMILYKSLAAGAGVIV